MTAAGRGQRAAAFLLTAAAAALLVQGRQSSALVQLQLCAAAAAFLAVGAAVEGWLGPPGGQSFPFHRLVLGQAALLSWFYLRSLLCRLLPLPSVTPIELWLLVAAATASCVLRSRPAPLSAREILLWAALWATAFGFIALWSGALQPPSSDPDQHAWLARLTAEHGRIVLDQQPVSAEPLFYPSGFAALNALWMDLSGAPAVAVVDVQVALQGTLAIALIVEAMAAIDERPPLFTGLLVIAFGAVLLGIPLSGDRPRLEGTARAAHSALWLWPLTLPVRLLRLEAPRGRRRGFTLLANAFALGFALSINPAHAAVQLPVVAASLLLAWVLLLEPPGGSPARWALAAVALLAIVILQDAWVNVVLRGGHFPQVSAAPAGPVPLRAALSAGLSAAVSQGISCLESIRCGPALAWIARWIPTAVAAAAVAVLMRRHGGPARAAALTALAASLLAVSLGFADGFTWRLLAGRPGLQSALVRNYIHDGLALASSVDLTLLFGIGLVLATQAVRSLRPNGPADAAVAAGVAAIALVAAAVAPSWAGSVRAAVVSQIRTDRSTSLGTIEPADIEFVRAAEALVPRSDRVLLPGIAQRMNPDETFVFPFATARAVPLYSNLRFAYFLGFGGSEFDAPSYHRRVCRAFDVRWLDAHEVRWIVVSDQSVRAACLHRWPEVRDRYFDEKLRRGDRALYELRRDRLPPAAGDPLLGDPEKVPPL